MNIQTLFDSTTTWSSRIGDVSPHFYKQIDIIPEVTPPVQNTSVAPCLSLPMNNPFIV